MRLRKNNKKVEKENKQLFNNYAHDREEKKYKREFETCEFDSLDQENKTGKEKQPTTL